MVFKISDDGMCTSLDVSEIKCKLASFVDLLNMLLVQQENA